MTNACLVYHAWHVTRVVQHACATTTRAVSVCSEHHSSRDKVLAAVITVVLIALISAIVTCYCCWARRRRRHKQVLKDPAYDFNGANGTNGEHPSGVDVQ